MHHVTSVQVWADGDGNVGLRRNVLEQLFGAGVHAAHEGDGVSPLHVEHDVEVTHLIAGGGAADQRRRRDSPRRERTAQQPVEAGETHPM